MAVCIYFNVYTCYKTMVPIASAHSYMLFSGETPLYIASDSGHSDVVNVILRSGADVNLACKYGSKIIIIYACICIGHSYKGYRYLNSCGLLCQKYMYIIITCSHISRFSLLVCNYSAHEL